MKGLKNKQAKALLSNQFHHNYGAEHITERGSN